MRSDPFHYDWELPSPEVRPIPLGLQMGTSPVGSAGGEADGPTAGRRP